ncbi:hypothetical protein OG921_18110 [Aldersonia sp. NBC_00410]|uniref:hypothetical protein n=1 Tax=Aldersonia sp. NBC_00410 TaxID=2975954 RepID=UPI00224D9B3D|nr:hypothetical protein [Aldersonia sp. NBC_00410]MCX5045084.1 hypothetical protein [Aldersonia sp. NBC_00410]
MTTSRVWYVAYGSNMSAARLACYLEGGRPPGGRIEHTGARDSAAPRRMVPITLPGSVFFAGESHTWGGGRAYYDPLVPGPTPARGYLVTREQFDDIRAQEPPVYDRVLEVGVLDDAPMYTFTSTHGSAEVAPTRPVEAYLRTIADGIAEAHGWAEWRIAAHFARLSGVTVG